MPNNYYDENCPTDEEVINSSSADINTASGMFEQMMEPGGTYKYANRRTLINSKGNGGRDNTDAGRSNVSINGLPDHAYPKKI